MGKIRKRKGKGKSRGGAAAPPFTFPSAANEDGEQEALPEVFWEIDEPAVLGLFVGYYHELSIDTFFSCIEMFDPVDALLPHGGLRNWYIWLFARRV